MQQQISDFDVDQVLWVDECGMHQDLYRSYTRSLRRQRVDADIEDKRFAPRISMIAAYGQAQLQALFRFEGYTNSTVFDIWVEPSYPFCIRGRLSFWIMPLSINHPRLAN